LADIAFCVAKLACVLLFKSYLPLPISFVLVGGTIFVLAMETYSASNIAIDHYKFESSNNKWAHAKAFALSTALLVAEIGLATFICFKLLA
jgi:hypothetical protein